jgi:hypothetical protein
VPQQNDAECRCVDASGDPIEDCTCFRMPRFEMAFAPFGARPRLGLSVSTDQGGTVDAQGARVTSVLDDGPAEEAGLEVGDVITRIDGRSLLEPLAGSVEADFDRAESLPVQRLLSIARDLEPGTSVAIEYLRGGERRTASVEARELSGRSFAYAYGIDAERMREDAERMREQIQVQMRGLRDDTRDAFQYRLDLPDVPATPGVRLFGGGDVPLVLGALSAARYGLRLVELNEGLGSYFGTSQGVLVTEVDDDSTLGLRPGDVILRVGDRDVTTPDRVLRLLATYEREEQVTFRIRRNGSEQTATGTRGG